MPLPGPLKNLFRGGKAPADPCTKETLAKVARVPYTATYYFFTDRD